MSSIFTYAHAFRHLAYTQLSSEHDFLSMQELGLQVNFFFQIELNEILNHFLWNSKSVPSFYSRNVNQKLD